MTSLKSVKSVPSFAFGFSVIFGLMLLAVSFFSFLNSDWVSHLLAVVALIAGIGFIITGATTHKSRQ